MAIAFVNASANVATGSGTTLATPATSLTAGNCIIVGIARHATVHGLNSLTDTAGNVYVNSGANFNTAQSSLTIWYCANCLGNGSNVVTADFGGSVTNRSLVTMQFSGLAGYPLDTWNISASTTSATPTTAALTTVVANEVICVFGENDATGGTWSASASYTLATQDASHVQGCAYQIVSAIQSAITPSITSTDSTNHKIAIAVTFAVPVALSPRASNTIVVADADANGGRFGVMLNATTGATTQVRLPLGAISQGGSGEGGAQLSDGTMLIPSKDTSSHNASIQIYDASLNLLSTTTPFSSTNWSVFSPVASDFSGLFWVSKVNPTPSATQVRSVTPGGTLGGTTFVLDDAAGPIVESMAVSQDNSTLYYTLNADGSAIKTWNLLTNAAGPALVAASGSIRFGQDLIVMPGTSSLIAIVQPSGGAVPTYELRRYSTVDGHVISSFPLSLGDISDFSGARMSLDLGGVTNAVWLRIYPDATGDTSGFVQISVVDGSILNSFTRNMNQGDVGGGIPSDPPLSCPFFAWSNNGGGGGTPLFVGIEETLELVRVRQVGLPALPGNVSQFIGRAEVQMQPGLGVPADPTVAPTISMAWSGDNAVTFGQEKALSLGRTGAYYTRAYQHTVGSKRQPAVRLTCSDDVTFVPTNLFVTREDGTG